VRDGAAGKGMPRGGVYFPPDQGNPDGWKGKTRLPLPGIGQY